MNKGIGILWLLALLFPLPAECQSEPYSELVDLESGQMYYETYGEGEPLLLLHGYFLSGKYWKDDADFFSDSFRVYVVDLTGHGKSGDFEDEVSIPEAADDLNALLEYLELDSVYAIGLSYGADLLFHLAARHPGKIRAMVTIGGVGTSDLSVNAKLINKFDYKNIENNAWMRWHQEGNERRVKWLCDHFPAYQCYMSDEMLKNVTAPALLMIGDDDENMPLEQVIRVRKNVPNTDLWILPETGHVANGGKNIGIFRQRSLQFIRKARPVTRNAGTWPD